VTFLRRATLDSETTKQARQQLDIAQRQLTAALRRQEVALARLEMAKLDAKLSAIPPAAELFPKPGKKPGSSGKAGKSPAKSTASSTSSGADLSTELAVAGELVKDLWGHLPERQREQILQPLSEEFLPQYASEIEAYFRALAAPRHPRPKSP